MPIHFDELKKSPEFTSSLVRLTIWLLATIFIGMAIYTGYYRAAVTMYINLSVIFLTYSLIVFISILYRPYVRWRTYLTIPCDIAGISYAMLFTDDGPFSPFFLFYIWYFVSYGARFGRGPLFVSAILGIIAFITVLIVTDTWYSHAYDVIAYLLFLIILPIYLDVMLRRINKARDEANRANRAKSEFLAAMSHEIRTPMSGIVGITALLKQTRLSEEQKEYITALQESASALHALIDDVLDLSKIEAGKYQPIVHEINLAQTVHGVAQLFTASANAKGIELFCFYAPELPTTVIADGKHLRQILLNLVSNAIKFTEHGEVSIYVSKARDQTDPEHILIRFEIRDTGPGITEQQQQRIFEPFYQIVDQQRRQQLGGTGLGTTISANLVKLMSGYIGLDSVIGIGTKFWFELPLLVSEAARPAFPIPPYPPLAVILDSHAVHREIIGRYCNAIRWPYEFVDSEMDLYARLDKTLTGPQYVVVLLSELNCGGKCPALSKQLRERYRTRLKIAWILRMPQMQQPQDNIEGFDRQLVMPITLEKLYTTLMHLAEQALDDPRASETIEVAAASRALTILVAEDSPINAKIITTFLTRDGHQVEHVEDGTKALQALQSKPFDLVLMDMRMPNMDGLEATRRWRQQENNPTRIPIIALTANATTEDRDRCLAAGMNSFLSKPATQEQLRTVIQRYCQHLSQVN